MVWDDMPYQHFLGWLENYTAFHLFSEKCHTGMLQGQYGSQRVSDYFTTATIVLLYECDVQLTIHQKSFVSQALPGPAMKLTVLPKLYLDLGEGTPGIGKKKGNRRKEGERDKVPYWHFFFPLPPLDFVNIFVLISFSTYCAFCTLLADWVRYTTPVADALK